MSSEGSYFPREMREQPDAVRDSLAETASARETLAERASEANRALIVVAAEGTVERELLVANYASRQGDAVAVVGKPEAGDGWPGDSLRLSVPMEGLAPRSSALVAMVPCTFSARSSARSGARTWVARKTWMSNICRISYTARPSGVVIAVGDRYTHGAVRAKKDYGRGSSDIFGSRGACIKSPAVIATPDLEPVL
jgi:hypothetical protein